MFDNLFMLLNENGSTNTLAGSHYVDLEKKRKLISFKYAYQGRKVMGTFRQTKPEINILFAVCQVLNLFVFNIIQLFCNCKMWFFKA